MFFFSNLAKKLFSCSGWKLISGGDSELLVGSPLIFLMSFHAFAGSLARCCWIFKEYSSLAFLFSFETCFLSLW